MSNPQADAESRRALSDIVDEVAKAAVLLEEMLTLARADSAPVSVPRTQVDLTTILDEACNMAYPIARQHGLTLTWRHDHSGVAALGDAAMLKRMIWIFLDNAMKYSRADGTISVSLRSVAGHAEMVVWDNGIGISKADLPHIFDRFYRADPSRGIVEGSGLGLAIAKWIAETHQAELSVTSEDGQGTSFTISFPDAGMSASREMLRGASTAGSRTKTRTQQESGRESAQVMGGSTMR